ncbi:MAG: PhoU domain-containing protein [Acidimicrobiales bacterium]|jgi:phosphate transport system protein
MNKVVIGDVTWLSFPVVGAPFEGSPVDRRVAQLFALVTEALAGATQALLRGEIALGRTVIEGDHLIDEITSEVEQAVWDQIDAESPRDDQLRRLIGILQILPELERSADLAKHIAQRAVFNLGAEMSPLSRGIVQRMTEVALEMWKAAADAFGAQIPPVIDLDEDDEEIDILHERLTGEVARGEMPSAVAAQVTLLARFYERLGDHAVNIASRIARLPPPASS